jgi:hypothetical protein
MPEFPLITTESEQTRPPPLAAVLSGSSLRIKNRQDRRSQMGSVCAVLSSLREDYFLMLIKSVKMLSKPPLT